jgi:hypothetical protein
MINRIAYRIGAMTAATFLIAKSGAKLFTFVCKRWIALAKHFYTKAWNQQPDKENP